MAFNNNNKTPLKMNSTGMKTKSYRLMQSYALIDCAEKIVKDKFTTALLDLL